MEKLPRLSVGNIVGRKQNRQISGGVIRKLSGRSECHRWESAFIKAVDFLDIVITEDVSEDNGFYFITFHFWSWLALVWYAVSL